MSPTADAGRSRLATRRPELHGVAFDVLTQDEAVEAILSAARAGVGGRVVTPNVDILREGTRHPDLLRLLCEADLVVADGAPVVWALRLRGTPVPERVAGSALAPALAAAAADAGVGLFLLGGNPGSAATAAARLHTRWPNLRVGWHCPPRGYEGDPELRSRIDTELTAFGACICLCGLGFPKQDRLGRELLSTFPSSWFVGAGASIGFLAGEFRRAPLWMQRTGLEWVHRLALEPRRLTGRYTRDIAFASGLLVGAVRERIAMRR